MNTYPSVLVHSVMPSVEQMLGYLALVGFFLVVLRTFLDPTTAFFFIFLPL